ncbi:hypothetical protein HYZ78_02910 [Candidatus Microgenomates bacterium]|nr:hypothetical protein [Candidatus Microgenomates bacterium]
MVIKQLISPVQAWLISQGRCVGCGKELANGKTEKSVKVKDSTKVTCTSCGRIFIKDDKTGKYRRALFEEV